MLTFLNTYVYKLLKVRTIDALKILGNNKSSARKLDM